MTILKTRGTQQAAKKRTVVTFCISAKDAEAFIAFVKVHTLFCNMLVTAYNETSLKKSITKELPELRRLDTCLRTKTDEICLPIMQIAMKNKHYCISNPCNLFSVGVAKLMRYLRT